MTVLGSVTPTVSISASATSICPGTEVTFTAAPVNGGGSPSYVWYINGTIQSGMTTSVFATTALQNNDIVTCELTSSLPCASTSTVISNDVQISVTNSITPKFQLPETQQQFVLVILQSLLPLSTTVGPVHYYNGT